MTGDVFYRDPTHVYPTGARGDGVYIYDAAGREYLDGSGGAAVSCLGHGNRRVIGAIKGQLDSLAFAHTAFFTSEAQEDLASRLARRFPERGAKVYFVSGGSEANEAAIKLARQYWVARGQDQKRIFVSRMQSYHGNTLGALSLSGNPGRRQLYGPILHDWPKISACFEYRNRDEGESASEYGERCANELEQAIDDAGAENVAAFVAETVVGATLGAVPAADGYFRRIREICDRRDVLLILDEVMSGCGRTGTYFAFEQEGILPDIVTMAKGLGGGYQPVGATLARGHVYDAIVERHGEFAHGHTYVGHPAACAAGVAVQQELDDHDLLRNVREVGACLRDCLHDALSSNPHVGDIRGRGLFLGVELVVDRATKEAPAAELGLAKKLRLAAMEQGLICYPASGTADGRNGVHVLLAPPFIYTRAHAEELTARLVRALAGVRIS